MNWRFRIVIAFCWFGVAWGVIETGAGHPFDGIVTIALAGLCLSFVGIARDGEDEE